MRQFYLTGKAGLLLAVFWGFLLASVEMARGQIVRDAEIENLLTDFARPVLRVSGIGGGRPDIVIINSPQFNAFVAGGKRIFINAGVLLEADTPNEVIGVIAHEVGHIAGGHITQLHIAAQNANIMASIATILGAGVLVAGAQGGGDGLSQAGAGILHGGAAVARNRLTAYRQNQEIAADRSALAYLERIGQSPKGLIKTLKGFSKNRLVGRGFANAYGQTHPAPQERIALLERVARQSPYYNSKDKASIIHRFNMAKAKIFAFSKSERAVKGRYPARDMSLAARYARTVAAMRFKGAKVAIAKVNGLLKQQPQNPYFLELKGQIYLESNQPLKALAPLRQAVNLAPNAGLIRILYGQALVATNERRHLKNAISQLKRGLVQEPHHVHGFRQLAIALRRNNDKAGADLATAKSLLVAGKIKDAKGFAKRAQKGLKHGSAAWVQAQDILRISESRP